MQQHSGSTEELTAIQDFTGCEFLCNIEEAWHCLETQRVPQDSHVSVCNVEVICVICGLNIFVIVIWDLGIACYLKIVIWDFGGS